MRLEYCASVSPLRRRGPTRSGSSCPFQAWNALALTRNQYHRRRVSSSSLVGSPAASATFASSSACRAESSAAYSAASASVIAVVVGVGAGLGVASASLMWVMAGAGAVASAPAVGVAAGAGAGLGPCSLAEAASSILFMRIGIREFSYCFIAVSLRVSWFVYMLGFSA